LILVTVLVWKKEMKRRGKGQVDLRVESTLRRSAGREEQGVDIIHVSHRIYDD